MTEIAILKFRKFSISSKRVICIRTNHAQNYYEIYSTLAHIEWHHTDLDCTIHFSKLRNLIFSEYSNKGVWQSGGDRWGGMLTFSRTHLNVYTKYEKNQYSKYLKKIVVGLCNSVLWPTWIFRFTRDFLTVWITLIFDYTRNAGTLSDLKCW